MTDIIKGQILKIRDSGKTNMFDVKVVFELAIENGFNELASLSGIPDRFAYHELNIIMNNLNLWLNAVY